MHTLKLYCGGKCLEGFPIKNYPVSIKVDIFKEKFGVEVENTTAQNNSFDVETLALKAP